MASSFEELGLQFEKVQRILRKEGEMPRPEDTRCAAQVGKGRCKNDITFVEAGDYWSKLCKEHHAADEKARAEGTARVARV